MRRAIWQQREKASHRRCGHDGQLRARHVERRQHHGCPHDGHPGSVPKRNKRKPDPCDEGQEDRWRSHTMDRELSHREDGGDGNRRQCHPESPRGVRCPAGLTRIADSLCDTHRWTDQGGG